jgi:hypothetical protein
MTEAREDEDSDSADAGAAVRTSRAAIAAAAANPSFATRGTMISSWFEGGSPSSVNWTTLPQINFHKYCGEFAAWRARPPNTPSDRRNPILHPVFARHGTEGVRLHDQLQTFGIDQFRCLWSVEIAGCREICDHPPSVNVPCCDRRSSRPTAYLRRVRSSKMTEPRLRFSPLGRSGRRHSLDFRRPVVADSVIHFNCPEKSLLRDSTLCEISILSREKHQAQARAEHSKRDSAAAALSHPLIFHTNEKV